MTWKNLRDNQKAAVLAAVAGVLMLVSGATGASQWHRTFAILVDFLGPSQILRIIGFIFIALGSVGGVFVLMGAYGFRNNRVRTARAVIWVGTGFTLFSLLLFIVYLLRQGEDVSFAGASLVGFAGVVLSVAARFKAKPLPLIDATRLY